MGKALRGGAGDGEEGRRALTAPRRGAWALLGTLALAIAGSTWPCGPVRAQDGPVRLDRGRFTVVYYPRDATLANSLVERAVATDSFPGLPRPTTRVLIAIAPDQRRFREWAGPSAPEWGAALAFPGSRRIVMQGQRAGSDAGDPLEVLRHELAHLALHEALGELPPRWFDEGYASYSARELQRNEVLAANLALALRGMPSFDELDELFGEGSTSAEAAYALAYRAVDDMADIDPSRGLALLFVRWRETGTLDRAMRAAYGITLAGFEDEWRTRTRRRYGGLALFGDLALGGVLMLLVITPLYIARRRRDRGRLREMAVADAASAQAEAERERLLEEMLGAPAPSGDESAGHGGPGSGANGMDANATDAGEKG